MKSYALICEGAQAMKLYLRYTHLHLFHLQISKQFFYIPQFFLSVLFPLDTFPPLLYSLIAPVLSTPLRAILTVTLISLLFTENSQENISNPYFWIFSHFLEPTNPLVISKISGNLTLFSLPSINSTWPSKSPTLPWDTFLLGFSPFLTTQTTWTLSLGFSSSPLSPHVA